MKKWLLPLLMIAAVLFIAGCKDGAADAAGGGQPATIDKIVKNKKVVVGIAPGYFPFEMKDTEGNFIGYDVDLANAIGESLGVEVEFKQFSFDALIPALQTGEIDLSIAGTTIRGDRALAVSFAKPYFKTGQVLMVPASDTTTKTWEDLDQPGKKIAVSMGTTGALLAKDLFQNAQVMDFDDFPGASTALQMGQADAVVYDEPAIAVWKLQNPNKVRKVEGLITAENLGIAVKKNDYATVQWLNSFLDSYLESPAELASRDKWFNSGDWLNKVEDK